MHRIGLRVAAAAVAATGFASVVVAEVPEGASTGAGPAPGGGRSGASFVDVLDTPSTSTPLAPRSLLNGVARAGSRLVAVGARGHVVYSDDEGKSWKQASVPVSSDLTAVHFPTARKGWATGHDGVILHSADAGASWVKQLDGREAVQVLARRYKDTPGLAEEVAELVRQGPDKPFLDVWFDDEKTGWAVGAFNFVFRTDDGGATWVPWLERTDNPKRLHLYAVRRIGEGLFVAGEQGLLLKLDPRQGRFVKLECEYNGTFFGLAGKPGAIVAFGLRGNAYRSADGGASWRKIETRVPVSLTGGTVTRDGRIVLVTLLGTVLASSDDGGTFAPLPSERALPAAAIAETETGALAVVGMFGAWVQAGR